MIQTIAASSYPTNTRDAATQSSPVDISDPHSNIGRREPYSYGTGVNGNMSGMYQNQSTMPYSPTVGGVAGVGVPNAFGVQPQYANQGAYMQPGLLQNQLPNPMGYPQVPNASGMPNPQQGFVGQNNTLVTQNPITGAIQSVPGGNMINGVLQHVPGGNMIGGALQGMPAGNLIGGAVSSMAGSHMGVSGAYPNQTLQNTSMFPAAQPNLMNSGVYGAQPGFPHQRQYR